MLVLLTNSFQTSKQMLFNQKQKSSFKLQNFSKMPSKLYIINVFFSLFLLILHNYFW